MSPNRLLLRMPVALTAAIILPLITCFVVFVSPQEAHADPGCQNGGVLLIFARGTGQGFGEAEATKFRELFLQYKGDIRFDHVELGNIDGVIDNNENDGEYRAIDVNWTDIPDSSRKLNEYLGSVHEGATELRNYLESRTDRCPAETILLAGYSQGAHVIGEAIPQISDRAAREIGYVALFGDPKYNASCTGDLRAIWAHGSAKCAKGFLGARAPYVPDKFRWRTGSWCDSRDPICNWPSIFISNNDHDSYPTDWMEGAVKYEVVPQIKGFLRETSSWPGSLSPVARTGSLIQSDQGHLYVLAGNRLFWFDRNDAAQLNAFKTQARNLTGSDQYIPLHHIAVHAREVNRDYVGNPSPGANMPQDNIFLREYGSPAQYVIKYQHPFPIGTAEEVIALGGQNQAVMVPRSIADLRQSPPHWVQDDLMQFYGNPDVWHYVDQGFRVPSVPVRDCLSVRQNRGVTLLPTSARSAFPTHATQLAACDFTHGQWLLGQPSNRQIMVLYNAGHYVHQPEVAPLGGTNRAVPVADETIDGLLSRPLSVPNDHLFRAAEESVTYHIVDGRRHPIGSPGMRDCLMFRHSAVTEVVPKSFVDRFPEGPPAHCTLADGTWIYDTGTNQQYVTVYGSAFQVQSGELESLGGVDKAKPISHEGADYLERLPYSIPENELIRGSGPETYLIREGKLRAIGNPAIRDCLSAETGKQVRLVPQDVILRMRAQGKVGPDAACALEGKLLLGPNGTSVAWIKDGYRRPVDNTAIRDCLSVRAGAGQPLHADEGVWTSYRTGTKAFCPYPSGFNFAREDGDTTVWLLSTDGTKRHVGSLCVPDPDTTNLLEFRVWVVPRGETAGHVVGPDWFASGEGCAALPRP